jgi:hypothetical protein
MLIQILIRREKFTSIKQSLYSNSEHNTSGGLLLGSAEPMLAHPALARSGKWFRPIGRALITHLCLYFSGVLKFKLWAVASFRI